MTYSYLIITPTVRRPIIEIIVKSKDKFAIYPVLIDSGADYCIFNIELAEAFGVKLSKKKVTLHGLSKGAITGRYGEIGLRITNQTYKATVLFAEIGHFDHGILGQQGFFDHFDVKLSYQKQTVEIESVKFSN